MKSSTLIPALVVGLLSTGASGAVAQIHPFEIRGTKAPKPPVIDGLVDDVEWQNAVVVTGFVQFEPQRGEPSPFRTDALVMYDAGHLYVAFRVFDPEPIAAQLIQRDADLFSDDSVMFLIDTYYDRRTAYYFMTNALGTQSDGRISDDGRTTDSSWDAPWQSAAQRTEAGWSAEFSVPFTSIKYVSGEGVTWGINFGRSRRRTLETSLWTSPQDVVANVSKAGRLIGLDVPPPVTRHQIVPYGLSRFEDGAAPDWQAGIDARYALTPRTSVYGTLYPDFATIEADQEEVNLTRFEVSLQEKRQFFLEGQEQFRQRIKTFYSRRIEDIQVGAKVLGKEGPWGLSFISARAAPTGVTDRASYTVGRLQRDVSGRSTVAVTVANRSFDGVSQGSIGLDATLFFTETIGMTAQVVKSYGPYGRGTEAFFVRPSYDTSTGHFHVRYTQLGSRFRDNANVIGQIVDDDRREVDSALEKTFWLKSGAIEQVNYGSNYNIYWSTSGMLRSWQIDQDVELEFRNRLSAQVGYAEEFKRYEKDFRNRRAEIQLGYNTREYESVSVGCEFGRNFDADFQLWSVNAKYKVTPKLSAEYSLERLVQTPDPDRESTWIHVIRANQFFTKDLFLRLFFQTNSSIDRRNVQAVFVYRYLPPFGTIQIAYQRGTAPFGERSQQGNTLFVKVTTVF